MAKAINLPSWKKLTVDWAHIAERHVAGGVLAKGTRSVFGQLRLAQVRSVVRGAYGTAQKVATQGDRVLLEGTFRGWKVEMWVNLRTKILETAYPVN